MSLRGPDRVRMMPRGGKAGMNSMEFNKIAGATIGALLVFLLLNFFSGMIYGTRSDAEHVAASDEEGPVLAYAVPVEATASAEPEAEQIDLHAIFANVDPSAGESAFRACGACHSLEEGDNKIGPSLYDVVGNKVAHLADYNYSDAMNQHGGDWTPELLFDFLGNPKGVVPGTKMSYAGMSNPQQRADVIAYLNEAGGTPVDLTEGLEPLAADAEADEGEAAEAEAEADTETDAAAADDGADTPADDESAEITPQPEADSSIEDTATPPESVEGNAEVTDVEEVDTGDEAVDVESTTPLEIEEDVPAPAASDAAGPASEPATGADETEAPAADEAPAENTSADEGEATEEQETDDSTAAEEDAQLATASDSPFLAGDAAEGEKVFRRCRACHQLKEGANGVGPTLHDVVGREIAAVEGFNYSSAMAAHDGTWTPELLSEFLADPKAAIPGNKMGFAGLKNEEDRINVITYLNEAAN